MARFFSKFDKNYKTTDPRSSMNSKNKKCDKRKKIHMLHLQTVLTHKFYNQT